MSVRDKIADSLLQMDAEYATTGEGPNAQEAADAIIAAIKASVPELVWDDRNRAKQYRIFEDPVRCAFILMQGYDCIWQYPALEAAKAAAQAHHVAQKTDWMDK